ncbi:YajG family lipoprotein [Psychromonas sp. CNPT3]|uniref:YajG family lipoprotein n=1 Tax=Psychromonas sp. CNPT3 TaxID=314282 RepID=UPI000326949C|nr:YajG family lipoprotein [Psychromonas sp. CNPT3]
MQRRFKNLLSATSVFILSACSSQPQNSVALQLPTINAPTTSLQSNMTWQLTAMDRRIAHYLIAISDGDDVATLINEKNSTLMLIKTRLQNAWEKQQLNIKDANDSAPKIEIHLIKLLTNVQQNTFSYTQSGQIQIKISLSTQQKHFSKMFSQNYSQEGAFKADVNDLTTNLNTQLTTLLNSITQDTELNAKLRLLNTPI